MRLLFALLAISILASCQSKSEYDIPDSAFSNYISGYTSGLVSAGASIRIQLSESYNGDINFDENSSAELFEFEPALKGKVQWLNRENIEFIPNEKLKSGQQYKVKFHLYKLIEVPETLKVFKFQFDIIEQSFQLNIDGLKSYNKESIKWQQLQGTIATADLIEASELAKAINIEVNGKKRAFKLIADALKKNYYFELDSIERTENPGKIKVYWNGAKIGIDVAGEEYLEIPALGDFKIVDIEVIQSPEQYVLIRFSDPLNIKQDLAGLVYIKGHSEIKTAIDVNELKLYPSKRLIGDQQIFVSQYLKNSLGYSLEKDANLDLLFETIKPELRLIGKGNILPSSNALVFPFEAVNLKAVDVKIIKIYANNITQFFQNNNLGGDNGLRRVGRLIRKKTIQLESDKKIDYARWNRFSLNLEDYIKAEPGAIYRIEISFRKHQTTYTECSLEENLSMDESDWDAYDDADKNDWDYQSDYSYDYYINDYFSGYDYRERDNPCSYSYYIGKSVSRNVFASNIGITVKSATNNELLIALSDLISAEAISGAEISIYDYQQQKIAQIKSDKNGFAKTAKLKKTPYFILVNHAKQKGYLRLEDGASLSLSRFDVGGDEVKQGIKGFLYGERGVWRPGDSIFLSFILQDEENTLPENHPVVFTLTNPKGQLSQRIVQNTSLNGFYNFSTKTAQDAPTGNWSANISVGGTSFSKNIKIETIKPNRLKVKLDFGEEKIWTSNQKTINGNLQINWLHGAAGKNLKADVSLKLLSMPTSFEKYKDYQFEDLAREFYPSEKTIFEGKVDASGYKQITAALELGENAPGMLKAVFKTRAFENGGDFSSDQFEIPYAPYQRFIGIRHAGIDNNNALETDKDNFFDIVSVNEKGETLAVKDLKVEVYKIEWSWWWERSSNSLGSYIGRNNVRAVQSATISTNSDGKAQLKVRIDKNDWGRYFIRVSDETGGHATGISTYFDWPSWMSRAGRKDPDGANMLSFSADNEKYNVGETAKISFPSAEKASALVTIEDGKSVLRSFWLKTTADETSFELPITSELAPNCYVSINLIQPHSQTENDAPIRLYGIIPLMVENPDTKLKPVLEMPESLLPEESFTLKVKEENGKPMTYTIAVVDEGLLDLTRFQTPNPWALFYAREALGVKTWDVYDWVIGAYGAKIENLLTVGGDVDLKPADENAIRFKPVVKFIGPFYLEKNKSATHTLEMPNYIGSVRAMLIAGQENAYGKVEKTVPVKKPLMTIATLPRVLGPKEKVKLPVTVFAMEKHIKNVKVEVKTNAYLKIKDKHIKQISFSEIGDQVVEFDLEVAEKTGIAKVEILVSSGSEKSTYEIELDIRNPNSSTSKFKHAVVEAGESWSSEILLHGMDGSNSASLEISSIPPINLEKRLSYLLQYPHACLEQITSKLFPQLYLSDIVELDSEDKLRTQNNIMAGIQNIRKFQLSNGGFSYWPGNSEANDWGTTYAGHFLLEAEKKGYKLPYGMKDKWLSYQQALARRWEANSQNNSYYNYGNNALDQAYRLYTLALAARPELSAMNRLRENTSLSNTAAWRLAAAYQIIGKKEVATEIIQNLSTKIKPYRELNYTYGSTSRDEAMILETLSLMGDKVRAAPLAKKLSEKLSEDTWMSTQTTAYALLAISKFTGERKESSIMDFSYYYKGKRLGKQSAMPIHREELDISGGNKHAFKIENKGQNLLFVRLISTGIPPIGEEKSFQEDLIINIRYEDLNGKEISMEKLEQGTDFVAEISISNPGMKGYYHEMSLSQIFPSGWEIHNKRMDIGSNLLKSDPFDYQDIRDDRVYTYFSLAENTSKTFRIALHAAYVGEYYLPAVHCQAMYDNSIQSQIKGQWVKVLKAGEKD